MQPGPERFSLLNGGVISEERAKRNLKQESLAHMQVQVQVQEWLAAQQAIHANMNNCSPMRMLRVRTIMMEEAR